MLRTLLRTKGRIAVGRGSIWGSSLGQGVVRARTSVAVLNNSPRRALATSSRLRAAVTDNVKEEIPAREQPGGEITSQDLLERYRGLVATGRVRWDDEQVRTIMKLRHLLTTLQDYSPPLDLLAKLDSTAPALAKRAQLLAKNKGWWDAKGKAKMRELLGGKEMEQGLVKVLSGEEEIANLTTPKGIMITGPPGTGKSFVLSLFYDLIPTTHKRRWHYHAFTLYLYREVFVEMERRRKEEREGLKLENMEKAAKRGWKSVFAGGKWEEGEEGDLEAYEKVETIPFIVARRMILDYHILYFDEMQLIDAMSAALLRDVLSWYWRLGGVIVTCSNRVPDDLYHHGVQKERMAGFLDSLKARCEVVELDGGRDYRGGVEGVETEQTVKWFTDNSAGFELAWNSEIEGKKVISKDIGVYGRRLHVAQTTGRTCRMTFADLCEAALGPADYLSLASTFDKFYIDAVPVLYLRNKNEARRLINLIDALYESRCQLFISSVSPLETLFFPDAVTGPTSSGTPTTGSFDHGDTNERIMAAEALSETLHAAAHPNVSVYNPGERAARERRDETEGRSASSFGVLGIWTGEDERFAYKRAVSRMREMTTSPTYANETWLPLAPEGRIWESKLPSPPPKRSKTGGYTGALAGLPVDDEEDFATEAAYSRPGLLKKPSTEEEMIRAVKEQTGPRGNPPVIGEKHVWGVVDGWGDKAGKWGKGAKAFKKE